MILPGQTNEIEKYFKPGPKNALTSRNSPDLRPQSLPKSALTSSNY